MMSRSANPGTRKRGPRAYLARLKGYVGVDKVMLCMGLRMSSRARPVNQAVDHISNFAGKPSTQSTRKLKAAVTSSVQEICGSQAMCTHRCGEIGSDIASLYSVLEAWSQEATKLLVIHPSSLRTETRPYNNATTEQGGQLYYLIR